MTRRHVAAAAAAAAATEKMRITHFRAVAKAVRVFNKINYQRREREKIKHYKPTSPECIYIHTHLRRDVKQFFFFIIPVDDITAVSLSLSLSL